MEIIFSICAYNQGIHNLVCEKIRVHPFPLSFQHVCQVGKLIVKVQIPSALELPGYKGKPSIIDACKLPAGKYFSQDKNGSRGCFNEGVFKKSYKLKT